MSHESEERLKRLRDAQIASRDPGNSKIRHYDWGKHAAKPQPKKRFFLLNEWYYLPTRIKGSLLGMLFGVLLAFILRLTVLNSDTELLMIVPILICFIVGFVLGAMFQEKPLT